MDRQTAVILEGIFGGVCALFAILWLILGGIPAFTMLIETADVGTFLFSVFWNIYFFWFLLFAIPASIFGNIKKNIDARPTQIRQVMVQPQQQQQVIQVNVPPPLQYTAIPTSPPPPQPRPPTIPPTDTIFCIHCGSQNVKVAKFCKVCGATIE
jgi:hypothetical protein